MDTNKIIRYVAILSHVFMTTFLLVAAVLSLRTAFVGIISDLTTRPQTPRQERTEEPTAGERIDSAQKEFLTDGTVHLIVQGEMPQYGLTYEERLARRQERIYDTNDSLLWQGPAGERPYRYLTYADTLDRSGYTALQVRRPHGVESGSWRMLAVPVLDQGKVVEKWRYERHASYFAGYEFSGRTIGYLGSAGPVETRAEVKPFELPERLMAWCPEDAQTPMFLWQTERRLYQIDFDGPRVELLFESPDNDIASTQLVQWDGLFPDSSMQRAANTERSLIYCLTEDQRRHLILKDPRRTIDFAMPDEWAQWAGNTLQFAVTEQGLFLRRDWTEYPPPPRNASGIDLASPAGQAWMQEYIAATKTRWVELYRLNEDATTEIINRFSWTSPPPTQTGTEYVDPHARLKYAANGFSPILADHIWRPFPKTYLRSRVTRSNFARECIQMIEEIRPHNSVWAWLVTAAMVSLTLLHGWPRRTSTSTFVFWLMFVALFNVAGFLTYWALNHIPTIRCAACGKRRGLGQDACVQCGRALTTPESEKRDLIFAV